MQWWWWTGSTLATVLLAAPAAGAQAPPARDTLAALEDSLQHITTVEAAQAFGLSRTHSSGAIDHLRKGFLALRQGELAGGRRLLDRALGEFEEATRLARGWPSGWYGRGLVKLHLSNGGFVPKATASQALGQSYYSGFVADITHAAELDSTFTPVTQLLSEELATQGDRAQPAGFIRALEAGIAAGFQRPIAHLVLARAYRTGGDYSRSIQELAAYEAAGGDRGVARLERARDLAGTGDLPAAAASYLEGAEDADSIARALYRNDISWIATDQELSAFDSAAALRPWLEHFWTLRGAESLRSETERLQEHLRRWAYVYSHFRVLHPEWKVDQAQVRVYDIRPLGCSDAGEKSLDDYDVRRPDRPDDSRRREPMLDHRAVIYMRHGEPWLRRSPLFLPLTGAPDSSAAGRRIRERDLGADVWVYWFGDAPRILYFAQSAALGLGPTTLYTHIIQEPELLFALGEIDPIFTTAAKRIWMGHLMPSRGTPLSCQRAVRLLDKHTVADATAAAGQDSYSLLFHHPLGAIIQTFLIGRPSEGTGRALVAYALPGEQLHRDSLADTAAQVMYPLEVRVSAVDTATKVVRQLDTIRTAVAPQAVAAGHFLTGNAELAVPAGRFALRVAVFQPGADAGTSSVRHGARIADASPGLSDLIPESEDGGLMWQHGADAVRINVLGAYRRGATAPVYYEVYGLDAGDSYRTTINLRKRNDRKARGVTLGFTEIASGPEMHVRRSIELTGLAPGQYELSVTVQEVTTSRQSTRSQLLNIVEK